MALRAHQLLVLALCLVPRLASAFEQTLELREHLGVAWQRQLVRLDFAAPEACTNDTLQLTGPRGPLAAQLVEPGVVAAIVDLEPLASDSYTLRCNATRANERPAADLQIAERDELTELTTSSFGARLRLGGERFASPRTANGLPGPIAGLRFADGEWLPGGAFYGPARVVAWQGQLVARGPLLAVAEWHYTFEGGGSLAVRAELAAGDSALLIDTDVSGARETTGFTLRLADPRNGLSLRLLGEGQTQADFWFDVPLATHGPGELARLTPWHDWWDETTQVMLRLHRPGAARELRITRRNAGAWVEPGGPKQSPRPKQVPLVLTRTGALELHVDTAAGRRSFAVGHAEPLREEDRGDRLLMRQRVLETGDVGRELERVRGMQLAWPTRAAHPHLYMNADELAAARARPQDRQRAARDAERLGREPFLAAWHAQSLGLGAWLRTGDPHMAKDARLLERLRHQLGLLGVFDTLRSTGAVCALYDAVMGSDLPSPEDRALFRAQLAYLGYHMTDPTTWSAERGYRSGNLNMTVAHEMQIGLVGAALGDHPRSREWMARAAAVLERLLAEQVGPDGEWPESPAHYASVAASPLLAFAMASARNGGPDFLSDPAFERFMLWLAKQYTPPDPRHTEGDKHGKMGLLVPVGRGLAGQAFGLHGAYASAIAKRNPELSARIQWLWLRSGRPLRFSEAMLGGWEHVLADPSLPAKPPARGLDSFARTGAILRHAPGTKFEWWVYFVNETHYTVPSESGTLPMVFARGVPISARFAGDYPDREELLLSRVLLARGRGDPRQRTARYNHEAKRRQRRNTSALPHQQYLSARYSIDAPWKLELAAPAVGGYDALRDLPEWPPVEREGKPGVRWKRQLLFVRPEAPDGAGYLVLRDRVDGGQPTMWQWWSVSEALGTPAQAANRTRFLARAPGARTAPARRLPPGDRYTALGPYGVDVEFYVAEPSDTPRYTLRAGLEHAFESLVGFREYQDLLHLQRRDDGVYFVAIFPRDADAAAPSFETLGGGRIVGVNGAFGRDLVFLSETRASASAGDTHFSGTAGSLQQRPGGSVLALGARGEIRHAGTALASDAAAELQVTPAGLRVSFPPGLEGASARITVAGSWQLARGMQGATLRHSGDALEVTAPDDLRTVTLEPR